MAFAARSIAGLVLAGGAGSRIGGDKAGRMLGGRSLLVRVIDRLAPQVTILAIGGGRDGGAGLPVLADIVPGCAGPLAGIAAGLAWARDAGHGLLLTAPCDCPFLPADLAVRLAAALGDAAIAVATSGGQRHHAVAMWRTDLAEPLAADVRVEQAAIHRWMARHGTVDVSFAGTPDPFFNVNTPEDLETAAAWLSPGVLRAP